MSPPSGAAGWDNFVVLRARVNPEGSHPSQAAVNWLESLFAGWLPETPRCGRVLPGLAVVLSCSMPAFGESLPSKGSEAAIPPGMVLSPLPAIVPEPSNNGGSTAKRRLGRELFFDPILSTDRTVACATCHHPRHGWADGRALPLGVGGAGLGPDRHLSGPTSLPVLSRNTPTVLNAGFLGLVSGDPPRPEAAPMFWDSRAAGLEAQVAIPIGAPAEMCGEGCLPTGAMDAAVRRLRMVPAYTERFREAFGPGEPETINPARLSQAIAAFERSLVSSPTPFDRHLAGDSRALSPLQKEGLQIFQTAGCIQCHGGPMFSDFKLHVIGSPGNGADRGGAFRTPSLRQLRHTAPYFHDGSLRTLRDVLRFYDELAESVSESLDGGAPSSHPPLDPLLRKVQLDPADFPALEAFLDALSTDQFDHTVPDSVPSGLPVGGK